MGLFGHGGFFSKVGHAAEKAVNKPLHELNKLGKKWFGNDSWYAGYNSNSGPIFLEGEQADQIMENGGISGSINSNHGYTYGPHVTKNQNYTGNTAKTANSIKQGGMTKDDLIEYNQKHPNETAGTNGSINTSLNSNTATTRY